MQDEPNTEVERRFYIPTTRRPVRINRIDEEEAGPSIVNLGDTYKQTGISLGYDSFVKRPTGIIHRLFATEPYPFYRMEVSDAVDAGESWELAVFLAHADRADGRRNVGDVAWATGTVGHYLRIGAVASVSEKVRVSEDLFEDARDEGRKVHVIFSNENEADLEADAREILERYGIVPVFVSRVDEALAVLGLPLVEAVAASKKQKPDEAWKGNPYRRLEPFREEHREVFFGRSRAREEALEMLRRSYARGRPFLLVVGPSGAGKSSFVRAGLVGDIAERAREGGKFHTRVMSPRAASTPLSALVASMRDLLDDAGIAHRHADSVHGLLEILAATDARGSAEGRATLLLVVDQLEEVLDQAVGEEDARAFDAALAQLIVIGTVWVIGTMRSDAYGRIDRLPATAKLASPQQVYRLDRPTPSELTSIVRDPAARAGRAFCDPGIVEELVAEAAKSPDSLPLLQTALFEFFERAGDSKVLERADFERLGGFEGAVAKWADETHRRLVAKGLDEAAIDVALASLVRIDPDTRTPLSRTERLDPADPRHGALAALAESRLAAIIDGPDGPRVRLAHEALLTRWPRLADIAAGQAVALYTRDQLDMRAKAWRDGTGELLAPGTPLSGALALVGHPVVPLSEQTRDYVLKSSAGAARTATRKRWTKGIMVAAGVAFLAVLGGLALQQERIGAATRDAAVSDAFRDAARADRELRFGSLRSAFDMASRALGRNEDLPFNPSVYQVLYGLAFGSASRELEMASFSADERPGVDTVALRDGVFVSWGGGEFKAWTPERGVVSVKRTGYSYVEQAKVNSDRSAVTFGPSSLHYSVDENTWNEFGGDGLGEIIETGTPISDGVMVGCDSGRLARLRRSDNLENLPAITQSPPLPGCRSVLGEVAGSLLVARQTEDGKDAFVSVVDAGTLTVVEDFAPIGRSWEGMRTKIFGDVLTVFPMDASSDVPTLVFKKGTSTPVAVVKASGNLPVTVSQDGERAAWGTMRIDIEGVTFLDIAAGKETWRECDCVPIGFAPDGDVVALRGADLIRLDPTGKRADTVEARLKGEPDIAKAFPDEEAVVAMWGNQPDVHVPIGQPASGTVGTEEFVDPEILEVAFVDGRRAVVVESGVEEVSTSVGLVTLSQGKAFRGWSRFLGYGPYLTALGSDLVAVSVEKNDERIMERLHVLDVATGRDVFVKEISGVPKLTGDGRKLIVPTASGLLDFDLATREWRSVPGSDPASNAFATLGNSVAFSTANRTLLVDLDTSETKSLLDRPADFLCSKRDTLVAVLKTNAGITLEARRGDEIRRRDWAKGEPLREIDQFANDFTDDGIYTEEEMAFLTDEPIPQEDAMPLPLTVFQPNEFGGNDSIDLRAAWPGELSCLENGVSVVSAYDGIPMTATVPTDAAFGSSAPQPTFETSVNGRISFDDGNGTTREFTFDPVETVATAYSAERRLVFAGLGNGELVAWSLDSDEAPMIRIKAHRSPVGKILVSERGDMVVTMSLENGTRFWPIPDMATVLAVAKDRLP